VRNGRRTPHLRKLGAHPPARLAPVAPDVTQLRRRQPHVCDAVGLHLRRAAAAPAVVQEQTVDVGAPQPGRPATSIHVIEAPWIISTPLAVPSPLRRDRRLDTMLIWTLDSPPHVLVDEPLAQLRAVGVIPQVPVHASDRTAGSRAV
jgi:hypothetical protein